LPRDKAIATIVRLLETTFMRIGNAQYARENESFGLTTLRGHQVRVRAGRLPQVLQRRPWNGRQYFGAYVALTRPEVRRDGC